MSKSLQLMAEYAKNEAGRNTFGEVSGPDHISTCNGGATMADYGHYPDSIGEINNTILADKRFGLTPQMRVLMNFIERFSGEHGGVMPSYYEMAQALGLKSKSGIHRLLESLVERGYIVKKGHRARSIQLVMDNGAGDEHRLSAAIKIILNNAVLSPEARRELYGIGRALGGLR